MTTDITELHDVLSRYDALNFSADDSSPLAKLASRRSPRRFDSLGEARDYLQKNHNGHGRVNSLSGQKLHGCRCGHGETVVVDDSPKSRRFAGLDVMIENPAGSTRSGTSKSGKRWSIVMKNDYGFVRNANGEDGEGLDVFLGPDQKAPNVYIVHQNDPSTGDYDEDKVCVGFHSANEAKAAYLSNYSTPKFFRSITEMPLATFKKMLTKAEPGSVHWKRKQGRAHGTAAMFSASSDAVELYSALSQHALNFEAEHWVTIGSKDHSGGTPVKIGGAGEIEAGPKSLAGKKVSNLDRHPAFDRHTGRVEKPKAEFSPERGKKLKDRVKQLQQQAMQAGKPMSIASAMAEAKKQLGDGSKSESPPTLAGPSAGAPADSERDVAQSVNRGDRSVEDVLDTHPHLAGPAMVAQHRREREAQDAADQAAKEQEQSAAKAATVAQGEPNAASPQPGESESAGVPDQAATAAESVDQLSTEHKGASEVADQASASNDAKPASLMPDGRVVVVDAGDVSPAKDAPHAEHIAPVEVDTAAPEAAIPAEDDGSKAVAQPVDVNAGTAEPASGQKPAIQPNRPVDGSGNAGKPAAEPSESASPAVKPMEVNDVRKVLDMFNVPADRQDALIEEAIRQGHDADEGAMAGWILQNVESLGDVPAAQEIGQTAAPTPSATPAAPAAAAPPNAPPAMQVVSPASPVKAAAPKRFPTPARPAKTPAKPASRAHGMPHLPAALTRTDSKQNEVRIQPPNTRGLSQPRGGMPSGAKSASPRHSAPRATRGSTGTMLKNFAADLQDLDTVMGLLEWHASVSPMASMNFSDDKWVTINGAHVFIEDGIVTKGPADFKGKSPAHLVGKTPSQVESHGKAPEKSRPGFTPIGRNAVGAYSGSDPIVAARLKDMKPPPGWTDLHLSQDANAKLQMLGTDSKGRVQYRYSAEHSGAAAASKFARIKKFVESLPNIRQKIASDLAAGRNIEEATVISLIDKTGFRVGGESDTGAKVQATGATTLDASQVRIAGDKLAFDFVGKKGVRIQQELTDPDLAKLLAPRVQRGGKLFGTNDAKVRDYLHGVAGNFKVKDFRTAVAADSAIKAMQGMGEPATMKSFQTARLEVGKVVAAKLGNTPTVALESYIPPEVFAPWEAKIQNMKSVSS